MAFSTHTTSVSSELPAGKAVALHPDWSDRIVTVVAISSAVLIVALIAVLMGMT
jgi:hypothetical protein